MTLFPYTTSSDLLEFPSNQRERTHSSDREIPRGANQTFERGVLQPHCLEAKWARLAGQTLTAAAKEQGAMIGTCSKPDSELDRIPQVPEGLGAEGSINSGLQVAMGEPMIGPSEEKTRARNLEEVPSINESLKLQSLRPNRGTTRTFMRSKNGVEVPNEQQRACWESQDIPPRSLRMR